VKIGNGALWHCSNFNIFEVENNQVVKSESIPNPGHKPGFLPNFQNDMRVNVIISGFTTIGDYRRN